MLSWCDIIGIIGLLLIVTGVAMVHIPCAVILAGVFLFLICFSVEYGNVVSKSNQRSEDSDSGGG